jgi:hypothetical protein
MTIMPRQLIGTSIHRTRPHRHLSADELSEHADSSPAALLIGAIVVLLGDPCGASRCGVDQVGDERRYLTCTGALCVIGWSADPPPAVDADEGVCNDEGGEVPPVEPNGYASAQRWPLGLGPSAAMMPTVCSADMSAMLLRL